MKRIQAMTATVYRGGNGRRYFTKKAAARSIAIAAYRKKYDIERCDCNDDTGPCDWHNLQVDPMPVIKRYARLILRRPVEEVKP